MFSRFREDIRAIKERDPAARSAWEVLTLYPGFHAIQTQRVAHWFWVRGFRWIGRAISQFSRRSLQSTVPCSQRRATSLSRRSSLAMVCSSSLCIACTIGSSRSPLIA